MANYDNVNADYVADQQVADQSYGSQLAALAAIANARGGGRVYPGLATNWGATAIVGAVPIYNFLEGVGTQGLGITYATPALLSGGEAAFDEFVPGDYAALGVRYVLLFNGERPRVPATLVARTAQYALWQVGPPDYVSVVDTSGTITADGSDVGAKVSGFLRSPLVSEGVYPTIAWAGSPAAPGTLAPGERPSGRAGSVLASTVELTAGTATATVLAHRTAVVVLSASFDPGWHATVDGASVPTEMVAPGIVGVEVSPGVHVVRFTYEGSGEYPALFAVAVVTVVAVALVPWWWRRRARRSPPVRV
jgi:hypothetical protein